LGELYLVAEVQPPVTTDEERLENKVAEIT